MNNQLFFANSLFLIHYKIIEISKKNKLQKNKNKSKHILERQKNVHIFAVPFL